MSMKLLWFVKLVGIAFAAYVVFKVKNNRLNEKESMFWILGASVIVVLAFWPQLLDITAAYVGVAYQPALLFFLGIVFILVLLFRQASHISQLTENNKELAQQVAILEFEIGELKVKLLSKKET